MSSRSCFRRKVMLPVTVLQHDGKDEYLAHTLDVTAASARLGGLQSRLEPGEIIELQCGAVKAKFEVVWMGVPGGAMAGQAAVRGLDPGKSIWNTNLPDDERDPAVDTNQLRSAVPRVHSKTQFPDERRWHPRYACSGSAAVKTPGSVYAVNGEVKDISRGGVYIELNAPLPVNSEVTLELEIEDIGFAAAGVVRTSYPLLGMGICFHNLAPESAEKLSFALDLAKRNSSRRNSQTSPPDPVAEPEASKISVEEDPGAVLAKGCRKLAEDFSRWKLTRSAAEIENLKVALELLQQQFTPKRANEFVEY